MYGYVPNFSEKTLNESTPYCSTSAAGSSYPLKYHELMVVSPTCSDITWRSVPAEMTKSRIGPAVQRCVVSGPTGSCETSAPLVTKVMSAGAVNVMSNIAVLEKTGSPTVFGMSSSQPLAGSHPASNGIHCARLYDDESLK